MTTVVYYGLLFSVNNLRHIENEFSGTVPEQMSTLRGILVQILVTLIVLAPEIITNIN